MRTAAVVFPLVFLLVLAVIGAGNVHPAPAAAHLPPLPDSIPSALGWVRVHKVPNLKCGAVDALGCFETLSRTLSIRDSMDLSVAWQTLKHEQLHMTIFDAGIYVPEDVQDELADAVGAQDVRVMLAQ